MKNEVLRVRGLEKRNENTLALRGVYLDLYEGEILGIIGLHDSGKTLLFNILCGLEPWDDGSIFLYENKVSQTELKKSKIIQKISDRSALIPDMSVLENIFVIRRHSSPRFVLNHSLIQKQLQLYLNEFQLEIDMEQKADELSLSEQHIIEIIKAYIHGARIILLENITARYSYEQHKELLRVISYLKAKGVSFILNGYKLEVLKPYAERFLFLVKGTTVKIVDNTENAGLDEKKIFFATEDHRARAKAQESAKEVVFEVRNFSSSKDEDISFDIHKSEIAVILDLYHTSNPNLSYSLVNAQKRKGSFFLEGKPIRNIRDRRNEICVADDSINDVIIHSLSLKDNLCLSAFGRISTWGFINPRIQNQIEKDLVQLYRENGFDYSFNIHQLSQPEKLAIYLYRIMIQQWKVLFVFNPENIFEYDTVGVIFKQFRQMAENGRAICIFASTIDRYADLANYYLLISRGRILGKFGYDELLQNLDSQRFSEGQAPVGLQRPRFEQGV